MKSTNPGTPQAWDEFMKSIGYDRRPAQDELVALISEVLKRNGYLLGRAGTGTGKSLASVVPSLAYAQNMTDSGGPPVLVSTATKALQGQYYFKDLPKMAEHFPMRKYPELPREGQRSKMVFNVLKGKRNYLCLDKLAPSTTYPMPIPEGLIQRLRELPPDHQGDVGTLGLTRPQELALTVSSDECHGRRLCPFAEDDKGEALCYYERAKERAFESDVVIVNHALVAAHTKIKAATGGSILLLPARSVLVLDECHKMIGYMQGALGFHMSEKRLLKWASSAIEDDETVDVFKDLVRTFFKAEVKYDTKDKKNTQQIMDRVVLSQSKILALINGMIREEAQRISEEIHSLLDQGDRDSKELNELQKMGRRTAVILGDLKNAIAPDDRDHFWVELDKNNSKILYYKPSEGKTSAFMKKHLWPESPAILLSATTPKAHEIGLPEDTEEFEADSPFDYKRQSRLFISSLDGSAPRDSFERELWEQRRHNEMLKLVAASDGRALLLFTSWADLNRAYEVLSPKFIQAGVKVLKQDREAESERDRLAKEFKEDEHSVLFGTESFFEGVDIPGRSCQLVIISKLPFPSMVDNTRGGKLDFRKEMLPEMRKKLVQAAGRLIRSHEDRGLVAVLDSRLRTKGYGSIVLANVSPFNEMTRVASLKDAMSYLESLEED